MQNTAFGLILSRLESIERLMAEDRKDSTESRRRVYERIETIEDKVSTVEHRIVGLERSVTTMTPTITEFNQYRERVTGARSLGQFLWWAGGGVLAVAGWIVAGWDRIVAIINATLPR